MRSRSYGVARTLSALLLSGAAACASSGTTKVANGSNRGTQREQALAYWQRMRDSMTAQAIADEEGPRVKIRASFESASGSRHLRASFTLQDDAYVLIGQLDAAGRLSVIFPETPDDNGFVRGDGKTYQTAERFAGFDAEYFSRARNNGLFRSASSQVDSYDRSSGYLFIVASWRPMRLDRISDGARFASYELNEYELTRDPRPAIAEFAALIAGDNREAYSLEFAQYYRSTPLTTGTYASAFSSGCSSSYGMYGSYFGYNSFGYGYPISFGCDYLPRYYFGWTYVPGPIAVNPTPTPGPTPGTPAPPRRLLPPDKPVTPPRSDDPRSTLEREGDAPKAVQPVRPIISADAATRPTDERVGPRSYRDRGLVTTDDGAAERPRAGSRPTRGLDRPSIADMMDRRRVEAGSDRSIESRYDRPRNARENVDRYDRPSPRSYAPDGGMPSSRELSRAARESEPTYSPSRPMHSPSDVRRMDPPSRPESPRSESPRSESPRAESPRPSAPASPRAEPSSSSSPSGERPSRPAGGGKPTPTP